MLVFKRCYKKNNLKDALAVLPVPLLVLDNAEPISSGELEGVHPLLPGLNLLRTQGPHHVNHLPPE